MNTSEIYKSITEKIIKNLETSGEWTKLWQVPSPVNITGRYYHGINQLILSADNYKSRVYATFNQIRSNGGSIRKGEHGTMVVFWKKSIREDEKTGEDKASFLLRYFYVFNSEQADFDETGARLVEKLNKDAWNDHNEKHQQAEDIINGYQDPPIIEYSSKEDRAYYKPSTDMISIPEMRFFTSSDEFYKTLFHELGHSTGHAKRLNRQDGMIAFKGDERYSREELVAELCASFLASMANLNVNISNSAAYIKSWTSVLRDNEKWILWASSRAEKAANYILNIEHEEDQVIETPALETVN